MATVLYHHIIFIQTLAPFNLRLPKIIVHLQRLTFYTHRSSEPASTPVAGIFMPVAAVDTRFRTPVGNVNASPASVECYATGKAEPFFYSRLS